MKSSSGSKRYYLSDLLSLDSYGIPADQVQVAINHSLMKYLPFMYGVVGFFFVAYAGLQLTVLRENQAGLMAAVALGSAALMFAIAYILRQGGLPDTWAEPLTAFGAALVLASIVLRAQLTMNPNQAANLALFLFAIAIIFISPFWYGLFALLTLAALVLAIYTFPPSADWPYFVVVTLAAMATGLLAHVVRVRAYRHTVILRIVERDQRQALQMLTLQLHTAVAVGQRITSILDQEALLPQVAELIRQQYQVCYVGLLLPDEKGEGLTAVAQSGANMDAQTAPMKVGPGGLAGWVMQHGRALRIDNVLQDHRFKPEEATPRTQSQLLLPLKIGDQMWGVLDLQSNRSAAFAEEEIPAYQLLADQVVIALENARLYGEVKQFNQELEQKVAARTQDLQAAYARLERLDKTKADFITIASHELRTPLTIVNFNSQMILEEARSEQHGNYLKWAEGIYRGVQRMEEVVENILDVAKIDSRSLDLFMSPLNMRFLVQQVVRRLEREWAGRQLVITVGEMPGLPDVEADAEAMEKLFTHLLMNAVKYTPDGGFIRVDGRAYTSSGNGASGNGHGDVTGVEIIVSDTGIGIAPEVQELVFEKFFQTGKVNQHSSGKTSFKGGGSGIGLAIARGIVEAHNGRIWVESAGYDETECPGSAFHVVLPLRQSPPPETGELPLPEPQMAQLSG
ncbi:MAG: GAF domain-containing sensor histidine kinase [Anaerolineae bacterium]|nr:GAF domain-containing sensor histidine kinase [Anaerolineae bacterium]